MSVQNKILIEVPEWNTYYPSLQVATSKQKEFYNYWLNQLEEDNFIDINGNLSYIFVYLYSVIYAFVKDKNIDKLLKCFEKINKGYGKYEKINGYLIHWTADAYLFVGDYDKAWELSKIQGNYRTCEDFLTLRARCKNTSIDGQDLFIILRGEGLTNFGKAHQEQIVNLASIFLEDFHKEHGKILVEYFCRQFDFSNLTEDDYVRLKEFFPNEKDFFYLRQATESELSKKQIRKEQYPVEYNPNIYKYNLFSGAPSSDTIYYLNKLGSVSIDVGTEMVCANYNGLAFSDQ